MSLSSFLLGKQAPIDKELDSLFTVPATKPPVPGPSKSNADKKRKLDAGKEAPVESASKRVKSSTKPVKPASIVQEPSKSEANAKPKKTQKKSTKPGKGKAKESDADSDDEKDEENLEAAYLKNQAVAKPHGDKEGPESDGEENEDTTDLVHESVKKSSKKRAPKVKHVPQEETSELRDRRTIFVGNLPLEVASKKPLNKQFQRHILSFLPTAKIESVRFRSIPFQAPTAKLAADDDGAAAKPTVATKSAPKKELRPHEKERANVWKSKLDEKDEEGMKQDEKRFLNPGQKKRIAFINHEFHSTADTVNAYVVFAHPPNLEGRPANLPPPPPTMDPYQAAQLAAEKCDGTHFMERMLRVDVVAKGDKADGNTDLTMKHASNFGTDPRLSVFVGNLEFASKEEDLRVFFEGVISAERGPPPAVAEDNNNEEVADPTKVVSDKPAAWVTRVRIVRDKDTQLGKGFAYVQFADRECVDELLALEEQKLKFAKRKLRVQRCKSLPGSKQVTTSQKKEFAASIAVVVPKGDPALGEKLAGKSKDERKQLKSADADRVARRLAKKKARMNMKPGVGKKSIGKDRKRVRSH